MIPLRKSLSSAFLAGLVLAPGAFVFAQEKTPSPLTAEGVEFFEKKIRPVLAEKCYRCHSAKSEKVKADLLLDTREGLLKGGESGPAIVPGDPEKSLLIHAVRYGDDELDMPPKESERLTPDQVKDFELWVKMGAPDPRAGEAIAAPAKPAIDFAAARQFWCFQPVIDPVLPQVREGAWPRNAIDRFILARLEEKGLAYAADAEKRTLIRRVTFDLTGLPPTPEEIDAFLSDPSAEAFSRVVDRLLASPHYGERWGRHWLDVIRYADTAGDNSDYPVPQLYKFRNYVIQAFNKDKPYDQFLREQIAGDLLVKAENAPSTAIAKAGTGTGEGPAAPAEAERLEKIIATGYLANSRRFASSESGTRHLVIEDTIDNLGRAFLGLTVNCARCHDHKFDAITNEDYYALYGIFSSTRYPFPGIELDKVPRDLVPLIPQEQVDAILKPHREKLEKLDAEVKKLEAERAAADKLIKDADETRRAVQARKALEAQKAAEAAKTHEARAATVPPEIEKDPEARRKFEELSAAQAQARKTRAFLDEEIRRIEAEKAALVGAGAEAELDRKVAQARKRLDELKGETKQAIKKREDYAKSMPLVDSAYAVVDLPKPENAKLHVRGEPKNPGAEVPRRFLEVLGGRAVASKGSGRLDLAQWITDPANPLTARVMANRIWQHHFGKGIVQTPSDFGVRGMPPTHPELLDYLAKRFVASGWSVKALHRLILNSRTYQLASVGRPENAKRDPANDFLWKFSRRRLEGEAIRDTILAVSGGLDRTMGGEHPFPAQSTWGFTQHRPFIDVYESDRRSVYLMTQRIRRHPFFAVFDGPDPNATTAVRASSTTPLQALFMMNDPFVHAQARKFAARLLAERPDDPARIDRAYLLAFGRPPSAGEKSEGEAYLSRVRSAVAKGAAPEADRTLQAWESYARVLLRINELVYVD